jgi:hypothetical protein
MALGVSSLTGLPTDILRRIFEKLGSHGSRSLLLPALMVCTHWKVSPSMDVLMLVGA